MSDEAKPRKVRTHVCYDAELNGKLWRFRISPIGLIVKRKRSRRSRLLTWGELQAVIDGQLLLL